MKLNEAKEQFIQTWGVLGSKWGINRTMAQIHALLLLSQKSLSADEIMLELGISRGNANMNLRRLMDWQLIAKEFKTGERREFFSAEKNVLLVCTRIMEERRKAELLPAQKMLNSIANIEEDTAEALVVKKTIRDFQEITNLIDNLFDRIADADEDWIYNVLIKTLMETEAPYAYKDKPKP